MGRLPTPDSVKEKLGKPLDPRSSDMGRAIAGLAKIHVFPTMREIPEPTLPLDEVGREEYYGFCRRMLDVGNLTMHSRLSAQSAAMTAQSMRRYVDQGKTVPGLLINQYNRAIGDMRLADADASLAPHKPAESRFATNGFSSRLYRTADPV